MFIVVNKIRQNIILNMFVFCVHQMHKLRWIYVQLCTHLLFSTMGTNAERACPDNKHSSGFALQCSQFLINHSNTLYKLNWNHASQHLGIVKMQKMFLYCWISDPKSTSFYIKGNWIVMTKIQSRLAVKLLITHLKMLNISFNTISKGA